LTDATCTPPLLCLDAASWGAVLCRGASCDNADDGGDSNNRRGENDGACVADARSAALLLASAVGCDTDDTDEHEDADVEG
jgi:hypothetical protein